MYFHTYRGFFILKQKGEMRLGIISQQDEDGIISSLVVEKLEFRRGVNYE
jgi:hypothetical protein